MALIRTFYSPANAWNVGLRCRNVFPPCFTQHASARLSCQASINDHSVTQQSFISGCKSAYDQANVSSTSTTTTNSPLDHGFNTIFSSPSRLCHPFNVFSALHSHKIRQFHTGSRFLLQEKTPTEGGGGGGHPIRKLSFHESMTLRLVNENGFLSWCRNSYISTVAALGMLNGSESLLAHTAGTGVLIVAAMNMLWGSGSHAANLFRLKKVTDISRTMLFLNLLGTAVHALFFVFMLLIFVKTSRRDPSHFNKGEFGDKDFRDFVNHRKKFNDHHNHGKHPQNPSDGQEK